MTSLRDELESYAADGRRAYGITGEMFDGIVTALRRDPRFAAMPIAEIELLLADKRALTEQRLLNELCGCIRLDDIDAVIDGVEI